MAIERQSLADIPPRKVKPYIFYGETTSLCDECLALVPAKILIEGQASWALKSICSSTVSSATL
jgi:hypothetical protein